VRKKIHPKRRRLLSAAANVGQSWTIDEQYVLMDACARTTYGCDFIRSTQYNPPPFEFALAENWHTSSSVSSPKVVRVYARGTFYHASLPTLP
jgi:hypothetical protein